MNSTCQSVDFSCAWYTEYTILLIVNGMHRIQEVAMRFCNCTLNTRNWVVIFLFLFLSFRLHFVILYHHLVVVTPVFRMKYGSNSKFMLGIHRYSTWYNLWILVIREISEWVIVSIVSLVCCVIAFLFTPKMLSYFLFDSFRISTTTYSRFNCVHYYISDQTQVLFWLDF